jgi:hypothetical protein
MGNLGKVLAAGGCLTFLLCFVLTFVFAFGSSIIYSVLGDVPGLGFVTYGTSCCSTLGFFGFVIGVILILVGGRSAPDPD